MQEIMSRVGYIVWASVLLLSLCGSACGSSSGARSGRKASQHDKVRQYEFRLPEMPPMLRGELARTYAREHLWDNFDFGDTLQLAYIDRKSVENAFEIYMTTFSSDEAEHYLPQFMRRTMTSKPMFEYFLDIAQKVLNGPNSLERDGEKYISVLEVALASDMLDEYEKMPYAHDLHIASQNRVGHRANDFVYTTADGRSRQALALKADYTLIFISNPECAMCGDIKRQIEQSPFIGQMVSNGRLKILVIYPDEDLSLWRKHLADYPTAWINAYDKGCVIAREQLYDLKAIPALYLLDREKRVLAKDCTDVRYIEKLISDREQL